MIRIEIELSHPSQGSDGLLPALNVAARALGDALSGSAVVVHRISVEEADA